MIRRKDECEKEYREHMRDGEGTVEITNFITGPEELLNKGRLFSKITLKPGCSIGYHVHEGDSELFYILTGHPVYTDGDTDVTLNPGDITICPEGTGHGIKNPSDKETVELVAVIVYK